MAIGRLESISTSSFDLVSVDVFDTILLRDCSVQFSRFLEVAKTASANLQRVERKLDFHILLNVRQRVHDLAYRAVALERPNGDAKLARMAEIEANLLNLDQSAVADLVAAELLVERGHLSANHALCRKLHDLRGQGKRIIALSDSWFSTANLESLISQLIPRSPIQRVYSSSDLGLTKYSGQVFQRLAELENVPLDRIVHCGDDKHADGKMARAAGCQAVLLRRPNWMYMARKLAGALTLLNRDIG